MYFDNVVEKLFVQEQPAQILWSVLENDELIGYGGLVHIDWESRNAEISFLTETSRARNKDQFVNDWKNYLALLKEIADSDLMFVKIYTYAYDLRPHLFSVLEDSGFVKEATLHNNISVNGNWYDVVIHSCFFDQLNMTLAGKEDAELYFKWANDPVVRANSYNSSEISFEDHCKWFERKLGSGSCFFYLFKNKEQVPVGQVRIERMADETVIGISIDERFRGRSLAVKMLTGATEAYLSKFPSEQIVAYIKSENPASRKSFVRAGFTEAATVIKNEISSVKLTKTN
jgi:RimJ/RimL family protein N-acetyltransferase